MSGWRDRLGDFDVEHQHMLEGGSLSQLFLRYPLAICHPVFVGAVYGILIGFPLLLPFGYKAYMDEAHLIDCLRDWGFNTLLITVMCSFLGGFSSLLSNIFKRPPVRLENRRRYLFPFPFIGLIVLSISVLYTIPTEIEWLGNSLLILPGPLYIHLSYAPRWRMLDRIDRGLDPFEGMARTIAPEKTTESETEGDQDLDAVVAEA